MANILQYLLATFGTVLLGVLIRIVWVVGIAEEKKLKAKAATDKTAAEWWHILEVADTFVRAAEQVYQGDKQGPAKKQFVLDLLQGWLVQQHINVDLNTADAIVEAQVANLQASTPSPLTVSQKFGSILPAVNPASVGAAVDIAKVAGSY